MFFKIGVLKSFAIFTGKKPKHTPTQLFSCEYCKIFKNSFFIEQLQWLLLILINAKGYRNDLNWLRSSVFTVNFEHILQFFQLSFFHSVIIGHFEQVNAGCVQNMYFPLG